MTTRDGRSTAAGSTGWPAMPHSPRPVVLLPYQSARHSRAPAAASGTPSLSQSSTATKRRARGESGSLPAKATNLRTTCSGSTPAERAWMVSTASQPMLSGRGSQGEGGGGPRGQRQRQIAAQAIADEDARPAARGQHRSERALEPAGDVVGERE